MEIALCIYANILLAFKLLYQSFVSTCINVLKLELVKWPYSATSLKRPPLEKHKTGCYSVMTGVERSNL